MRLWPRRAPVLPVATRATPPPAAGTLQTLIRALAEGTTSFAVDLESVGAVDRCLQLNAQQVATMPLRYRHAADIVGREPAWVHDADPAWFPNGTADAVFAATWSIYAQGEAFLWVTTRYDDGYPRTWTVLDPVTMKVEDGGGRRAYSSNGFDLNDRDVVHVMRNPNGGLHGRGALEAWAASLASLSQAEEFAADFYTGTGVNRVALKSKIPANRWDRKQAEQLQADWVDAVSRRMGAPAILPADIDLLEAISISPRDLLLLESREWDTRQVASAFGVPAFLLNIALEGALVYQSPAQLIDLWWRTELMPASTKLARALSRWTPRGHWVEFDPGQALRPDLPAMISAAASAIDAGMITEAEARAWVFDLPPLPAGDAADELFEEEGSHGSTGSAPTVEEVVVA